MSLTKKVKESAKYTRNRLIVSYFYSNQVDELQIRSTHEVPESVFVET